MRTPVTAGPVPAVPSLEQRLPRDTHGELRPQLHVVLEPVPARGRHEEIAGRSEERQDDDNGEGIAPRRAHPTKVPVDRLDAKDCV